MEKIKFSIQKPIWKDGINIPTMQYLDLINADFEKYQVDMKINYLDDETVQLIVPNVLSFSYNRKNYVFTYADVRTILYEEILSHQNMLNWKNKFYYSVSKIEKFSNNAKLITFKLDYTLTYTIPFLDSIKNEEVFLLRAPTVTQFYVNFDDPLMKDLKYEGRYEFQKYKPFEYGEDSQYYYWDYYGYRIKYRKSLDRKYVRNGVIYAVFNQGGTNNSYLYIPILADLTYGVYLDNPRASYYSREVDNSYLNITLMKYSKEYSNKFMGYYFLPHTLEMYENWQVKTIKFTYQDSPQETHNFLCLDIEAEGTNIPTIHLADYQYYKFEPKPRKDDVIDNFYLTKYFKTKYFGQDIDLSLFKFGSGTKFGIFDVFFSFTSQANLSLKNEKLDLKDSTISFPNQIPSMTDDYIKYVSGITNTTNTSVNVAKQQYIINSLTGAAGTLFGGIANAGNVAGLVQTGINGTFGLLNSSLNYFNQMKMLSSQFSDSKNRMTSQISNSISTDASLVKYYWTGNEQYVGLEVFTGEPTFNKQINSIIYYYSYYAPQYIVLSFCFNKLKGSDAWDNIYLQFEEKWLSANLYSMLCNTFGNFVLNEKIYNWIYNQFINGIRLYANIEKTPK